MLNRSLKEDADEYEGRPESTELAPLSPLKLLPKPPRKRNAEKAV